MFTFLSSFSALYCFIQVMSRFEDNEDNDISMSAQRGCPLQHIKTFVSSSLHAPMEAEKDQHSESYKSGQASRISSYKRTLSTNLQNPQTKVPKKEILQRIKSRNEANYYQLGEQLSMKWSTGAGPRIGCVADYPLKLRVQALEFVNLTPMVPLAASASKPSPNSTSYSFCRIMWVKLLDFYSFCQQNGL